MPTMLQDTIVDYVAALATQPLLVATSDASAWTIVVRRVGRFVEAASPITLDAVTPTHVRLFLSGFSAMQSDEFRATLATFFQWAVDTGRLETSPMAGLRVPWTDAKVERAQRRRQRWRAYWQDVRDAAERTLEARDDDAD